MKLIAWKHEDASVDWDGFPWGGDVDFSFGLESDVWDVFDLEPGWAVFRSDGQEYKTFDDAVAAGRVRFYQTEDAAIAAAMLT